MGRFDRTAKGRSERNTMPIILIGCWLAPMLFAMPLAISEMEKEKKVNEICVQNFKTVDEVQQCKTVLMQMKPTKETTK